MPSTGANGADPLRARQEPAPGDSGPPEPELDEVLTQLIDRTQDVIATQGRLGSLLRANQAIVGNLPLPVLLRRIVRVACDLSGARYGALGVSDGSGRLEQFVHVGISDDATARMSHLPEGRGLLGLLIEQARPIRLRRMSDHPRSVGFPPEHPQMTSFLGVPVRVRDTIFGHLYLTESTRGEFSAEDEDLVLALAVTAGIAIDNTRLYEEAGRRQDWLQASTEVTQRLLSATGEDPLKLITRQAQRIAGADIVSVLLPAEGETFVVEAATGHGASELAGRVLPRSDSLAEQALLTGQPVLVPGEPEHEHGGAGALTEELGAGPLMVLPLGGVHRMHGALVIARAPGTHPFSSADLEMATTFAGHATVALELAAARADQLRIARLEDRNRIARDLHDHVIQRLFAIGLTVQSVATGSRPNEAPARLERVVNELNDTIRQTRTSIFELRGPLGPATGTVRVRLLAVAAEVSQMLGFHPHVRFIGPVEAVVPDDVADDLEAVLREALTNTARHARAQRADVELTTTTAQICLEVTDDGQGIGPTNRRSGLANLRQRAERRGGSLLISRAVPALADRTPEGTCLRWTVPLS